MEGYLRGQIASMANVNIETLRYYENHGLIPSPIRSEAGYRLYSEEVLVRLAFIKNAKSCGFTLKEIRKALTASTASSVSIADFVALIDRKIEGINQEIAQKEKTKAMLSHLKSDLQASHKAPEIQELLDILHMKS
ncbi:MerR family transcriptional regulator [Paenibacillus albiflavus]|uniref:MerR family transcriptional regulator n=1 Tax=Paenibacillus albiflavus TaxID=2545760 RepID=A0A4V2WPI0_9BACL|nr:MerR family transcriptional regulator [Paenibacillus albiflavus]TCZ79412.1 MerR family transcriptional regulator [Paenibacillus albiflavus]